MRDRVDELGMDAIHEIALKENEFRELLKAHAEKLIQMFSDEILNTCEYELQLERLRKIYVESKEEKTIYAIIKY